MEYYYKLMDMLEEEIEEITRKGQLSAGDIDIADKVTHTIKSVECILEKRMRSNSYDDGGYSNARRRDSMGRYADGGSYAEGNNGYSGRRSMEGYSGRRYSRDEGKSQLMHKFESLMDEASSQEERNVIQSALSQLKGM